MTYRHAALIGVVSMPLCLMAGWIPPTAFTQAQMRAPSSAAAEQSGAPRTPWGDPDLQGIWNDETATPLQRPAKFAAREFLTDEEVAELDRQRAALPGRDYRPDAGTEADVSGAYNAFWNSVRPTGRRTSLVVNPPDGRIPPLTPEAQARAAARNEYLEALLQGTSGGRPGPPSPRRAEAPPFYNVDRMNRADGPEDRSLMERCIGGGLPDFSGYYRIVQSPGYVVIYHDTTSPVGQGFTRAIPLTDRPQPPEHVRLWWGDARGRWDGETLVVETSQFTAKTDYRGSREHLQLIERFTRVGSETIDYELTISDPTTWTSPWTIKTSFTKQSDFHNRVFEQGCHEGNWGMVGMLANMRAAERAFAEGRGPDPALQDNATGGARGPEDPLLR